MEKFNQKLSREVEWFVTTLEKKSGVIVAGDEIAVEATELGMEEVEEVYVSQEVFEVLPGTLLYELMIVNDAAGVEWIGAIGFHPDSPEWCIQVITKNGLTVHRQTLPLERRK